MMRQTEARARRAEAAAVGPGEAGAQARLGAQGPRGPGAQGQQRGAAPPPAFGGKRPRVQTV